MVHHMDLGAEPIMCVLCEREEMTREARLREYLKDSKTFEGNKYPVMAEFGRRARKALKLIQPYMKSGEQVREDVSAKILPALGAAYTTGIAMSGQLQSVGLKCRDSRARYVGLIDLLAFLLRDFNVMVPTCHARAMMEVAPRVVSQIQEAMEGPEHPEQLN